jgi:hypothetical protein
MDGDPDAEAFGNEALPKCLAQGWRVSAMSPAGKQGERHFHLLMDIPLSELIGSGR